MDVPWPEGPIVALAGAADRPTGRKTFILHNRVMTSRSAAESVAGFDPGAATRPLRIHADRAAGRLEIGWADGHETAYEATPLRWLCPCAFCRGEAGMPGWLDGGPSLTAEQVRLVDVHLIGSYAIAPSWADGHHTGYYTYSLLRDHCPCAECSARRGVSAAVDPGSEGPR